MSTFHKLTQTSDFVVDNYSYEYYNAIVASTRMSIIVIVGTFIIVPIGVLVNKKSTQRGENYE